MICYFPYQIAKCRIAVFFILCGVDDHVLGRLVLLIKELTPYGDIVQIHSFSWLSPL